MKGNGEFRYHRKPVKLRNPGETNWPPYVPKKLQLEQTAAAMREYYLSHGSGCKSRAKAIAAREGR